MGYLHVADLAHAFLTFLLFFEQLALARDVAAVAFGSHVFTNGFYCLSRNDFGSDGCLDGDVELLPRYQLFQFFAHLASEIVGVLGIDERRKRVDRFAVQQNVQFGQFRGLVACPVIIERRISFRNAFQLVVEDRKSVV